VNIAAILLCDCQCEEDGLFADVFFWNMLVPCCGVYLVVNVPAPSARKIQFVLTRNRKFLAWGECN
jgi:hypothetical protein